MSREKIDTFQQDYLQIRSNDIFHSAYCCIAREVVYIDASPFLEAIGLKVD
jgi:hypothetical protein